MKKVIMILMLFFSSISAFAEASVAGVKMSDLNMTQGVTPISQQIYDLHMTIFWVCVVIGVIVFGAIFYILFAHRKSRGHKAHFFHESVRVEIAGTIIRFIILVVMAIPATIVMMHMDDTSKAAMNIKITGYQWKWQYEYLDEGLSFFSNLSTPQDQLSNKAPKGKWYLLEVDHPLVVPIHKKIRFLVTSNDVVHSWWVPALGIKRDAIPGFIYEAWATIDKPGTYRGQCAELCGMHHGFMPIVVVAMTQPDYEKWVIQERTREGLSAPQKNLTATAAAIKKAETPAPAKNMTHAELMTLGKQVYSSNCSVCHQENGAGSPPTYPAMKGSKTATGLVQHHILTVLNGRPGTEMQAFGKQLSDQEIAAVITYERNSWGNADQKTYGPNAGGVVQPIQVQKAINEMSLTNPCWMDLSFGMCSAMIQQVMRDITPLIEPSILTVFFRKLPTTQTLKQMQHSLRGIMLQST